ncbi:MAG: cupin domain-containing protein [Syntrophales bacterium]
MAIFPLREMMKGNRMKRILYAICLTLLLASNISAADVSGVEVTALSKSGSSWDGRVLPDYPNGKPEVTILRIKIPPGAVLPLHKHLVINAGIMISGELTVGTEDGKTLHLKAGETIIEVVNTWHHGKNEGNKPAEIVVFYVGTMNAPLSVNK